MSADCSTPDPMAAGQPGSELAARVAQLIYSLRNRGITADTRQAIAVEQLLISLQPRWTEPDFDLAAHLGPIFCRSMEEQRRFREVVAGLELFRGRAIPPVEEEPASPTEPPQPPKKPSWLLSWRTQAAALIVLMIGAIAVFQLWPTPTPPVDSSGGSGGGQTPTGTETPPAIPPIDPPPPNNTAPAKLLSYRRIMLRKPLAKSSPWSWAWAAVPLVCLAGWYVNRRGQRPRLRRESTDLPQVFREVRLPGGPREPLSGLRVRELSRSLRIRQRVAGRELHIDATITRTIENGGLPTPVFESLIEPQYLVLIDRTGSSDHFGELSRALLSTLKLGHVDYEAFEFDGNPTYCNIPLSDRRATERFRLRLTEILDKLPDRPLLILGDGAGFLNPFTEAPPEWFTWVADRPRILVTPASDQGDWTARELKLRRHGFQVIPMTPTGIPEVAAVLTGIESPRRTPQRYSLSFEDEPDRCLSIFTPPADFIQRLCRELRGHLGSDGFLWLASLGAYPELHWGLTLRFGASLMTKPDGTTDEERWEQLLPRMSRLIWLRQGYMPDWLREALREKLSLPDQNRIHQLLVEILSICQNESTRSESPTAAAKEVPLRIVIEKPVGRWNRIQAWWKRWQFARQEAFETRTLKQRLADSWQRWTAGGTQTQADKKPAKPFDAVFLRYLAPQVPQWLAPRVPERLLKLLKPLSPREGWLRGPSLWMAVALCAVAMVGVFSGAETVRSRRFQVQSLEVSHHGERLVTRHANRVIRAWNNAPSRLELRGHVDRLSDADYNLDGTRVVTASWDKTARVWDAATGAPVGPPLRHEGVVWSARFSPDGTRVVTASADQSAWVWDAATGEALGPPLRHEGTVWSASFSLDGTRIVTASFDKTARVWDATTGAPVGQPLRHDGTVPSASFSPDGTRIVTASLDKTAQVWDAATGEALGPPLRHELFVNSARFSPDGTRIVTASADQTARVWDAVTGTSVGQPFRHQNLVRSASFSPDGTRVVTASEDNTARVWDLGFEKYDAVLPSGSQWIGMSADGQRWAEKAASGEVVVYELGQTAPVFRLDAARSGDVALLSDDGARLAVARKGEVTYGRIPDAVNGTPPPNWSPQVVTELIRPIGGTWGSNGHMVFWDNEGHLCVVSEITSDAFHFKIPTPVLGHAQSLNRKYLMLWGKTGPAVVVDTEEFLSAEVRDTDNQVHGATLSNEGNRLFYWNSAGRGEVFTLVSEDTNNSRSIGFKDSRSVNAKEAIRWAGFSQSGEVLLLLSEKNELSFSLLNETAKRIIVEGVKQVVQGDGDILALVFTDGSVRLYDAQFGVPLSDPLPTSGKVTLAAFGRPALPPLESSPPPMSAAGLFQVPYETDLATEASPSVAFRSATGRSFAGRKTTLSTHSLAQAPVPKSDFGIKGEPANPKQEPAPLNQPAPVNQEPPPEANDIPSPSTPPDTPQALSLVTEDGNIEVWELNHSGRAVALLISGADESGSLQPTKDLARVLETRFGFEVTVLERPTRQQVEQEWARLRSTLAPSDRFVMVLEGESDRSGGQYTFALDGTLKEKITSDDIRQFMDSTRAGQSLLIAASSYTGMMKSETVVQAAKAAPPRSILVLTASGPNDHSYFVSGWDKLLTPVQHALESDQPPFDGPFDAEALWTAVQAEAKVDIQTRPDTPTEASGPIQFGPLAGSQHTPGARFYFPDPRQAASSPDPAVTKPDAAQDDPAPTVPPVDTKAAE